MLNDLRSRLRPDLTIERYALSLFPALYLPLREYPSNIDIVNYLWGKRIKIILPPKEGVSEDLSNFPVKVWLSASSGLNASDLSAIFNEIDYDSRKKIAVTTSDGTTQCNVEIVSWDTISKQAELWVKVPTLSATTDTILYLYYDATQDDNNTYVGDTGSLPAQAVWDANFVFVSHMNDSPDGLQVLDSTANANHGTKYGCTEVDGLKGKAQSFDGVDDYIDLGTAPHLNFTDAMTAEALANITDDAVSRTLVSSCDSGWWSRWRLGLHGTAIVFSGHDSGGYKAATTSSSAVVGSTKYITGTWDSSAVKLYINNSLEKTVAVSGSITNSSNDTGNKQKNISSSLDVYRFKGTISEVRLSNIARSASWIAATNATLRDELAIYSLESAPRDKSYARPFYPSGCIWTPSGFRFDGADDLITFESDFIGVNACTIMGWIKPTGWGGGGGGRIVDNGKLGFYVYGVDSALYFTSSNMVWISSANNSITLNQWHHVAVTRKSDGKATLYINGQPSGTPDQNSGTPEAGTTNIVVGNRLAGDRAFKGTIDELLEINRVLSPMDIRTHYQLTRWRYQ